MTGWSDASSAITSVLAFFNGLGVSPFAGVIIIAALGIAIMGAIFVAAKRAR